MTIVTTAPDIDLTGLSNVHGNPGPAAPPCIEPVEGSDHHPLAAIEERQRSLPAASHCFPHLPPGTRCGGQTGGPVQKGLAGTAARASRSSPECAACCDRRGSPSRPALGPKQWD